jgi:hypothetical protein
MQYAPPITAADGYTLLYSPASKLRSGGAYLITRSLGLCLACFISLIALFITSQALSLRFASDGHIQEHLREAINEHVLTAEESPISPYGHSGHSYDMFTDCIAMSVNLGNKNDPFLWRLAATPYVGIVKNKVAKPCQWFVNGLTDRSLHPTEPYFRYWHGAEVYLRPLLTHFTLAQVRILNALLLIASLYYLAARIGLSFGRMGAVAVVGLLMTGTSILTAPAVTVHALTWIWAFFSLGLVAWRLERHDALDPKTIALVFSMGCVANFFDVLFSPPFAPTFIAFLVLAFAWRRSQGLRHGLVGSATMAAVWFTGFCLTWISKWLFAAAVLSWNSVIGDVRAKASARSFGDPELLDKDTAIFDATSAAFTYIGAPVFAISGAVAIGLMGFMLYRKRITSSSLKQYAVLLTPLIIPVIWVELLRDHTLQHPGFESRAFIFFAIIPVLAALALNRGTKPLVRPTS